MNLTEDRIAALADELEEIKDSVEINDKYFKAC